MAEVNAPDGSSETEQNGSPLPATRKRRGFAGMDPALVRELARRGGRAAQESGKAHRFTSEEARAAAIKGRDLSRAARKEEPSSPDRA